MFFAFGFFKFAAILLTPIVLGLVLLPARTLFPILGWLFGIIGAIAFFSGYLRNGGLALGLGIGLIALGVYLARKERQEQERDAEETASRINRMMRVNLPTRED